MVGGTPDFDDNSQSTCSISNSEDSTVKSRNVNTLKIKIVIMSINDQLKMIKEEKHQ